MKGDQSAATGQCVDCSRQNCGKEKQEVIHHSFFLLVLMLLLVCSGISASPRRIDIMQPASLMPARRDHRSRLQLHGKASRSTLPPVKIIPTLLPPTSILPS